MDFILLLGLFAATKSGFFAATFTAQVQLPMDCYTFDGEFLYLYLWDFLYLYLWDFLLIFWVLFFLIWKKIYQLGKDL